MGLVLRVSMMPGFFSPAAGSCQSAGLARMRCPQNIITAYTQARMMNIFQTPFSLDARLLVMMGLAIALASPKPATASPVASPLLSLNQSIRVLTGERYPVPRPTPMMNP